MKDYEYFKAHRDELIEKYPNKFVVIKSCAVVAVYDAFMEAYNETVKTEALGTFIIQQCVDDDSTAAHFHNSNVKFA